MRQEGAARLEIPLRTTFLGPWQRLQNRSSIGRLLRSHYPTLPTFLRVIAGLALAAASVVACVYQPEVPDGSIRCDSSQRCPTGTMCTAAREGAAVHLVCCRNPGCQPRVGGTGASIRTADQESMPELHETELDPAPARDTVPAQAGDGAPPTGAPERAEGNEGTRSSR